MDLKTVQATTEYRADKNHCAVVATAVAFNMDFKTAQEHYDRAGRRRRKGTSLFVIGKVIGRLKQLQTVKVEEETPTNYTNGKTMTANNCVNYLDEKCNYIALTTNHAIGIKAGKVEDWTEGRRHRITKLYKITPEVLQAVKVEVASALNELNELMSKF